MSGNQHKKKTGDEGNQHNKKTGHEDNDNLELIPT